MGWIELQEQYRAKNRLINQSQADRIARRVLNSLGLVERQLGAAEIKILGRCKQDEPLWDRTVELCYAVWRSVPCRLISQYKFELVPSKQPDIQDRLDLVDRLAANYPVLCCYDEHLHVATIYTVVRRDDLIAWFDPPFKVQRERDDLYYVVQTAEDFVKQFGPYDWSADEK